MKVKDLRLDIGDYSNAIRERSLTAGQPFLRLAELCVAHWWSIRKSKNFLFRWDRYNFGDDDIIMADLL